MTEDTVVPLPVSCTKCSELVDSRSQIVNGVGPEDADIVIVGEAPGENEDVKGEPFVGRSGDVLTSTLNAHGITRDDVRITNTVRCRPPDNRDPTEGERAACRGYLVEELVAIDPNVVVAVGRVPVEELIGDVDSVTGAAGEIHTADVDGELFKVLASVHPAATLYDRSLESVFDETFRTLAELTGFAPSEQTGLGEY